MKQYKSTSRAFAHEMRNESTFSEVLLWMQLRASKLGYPFKRQVPIGNYIVDFYCPSLRLAIEVDGGVHSTSDAMEHDDVRTAALQSSGITIVRVTAHDCEKNMENALMIIEVAIMKAEKNLPHPLSTSSRRKITTHTSQKDNQ